MNQAKMTKEDSQEAVVMLQLPGKKDSSDGCSKTAKKTVGRRVR